MYRTATADDLTAGKLPKVAEFEFLSAVFAAVHDCAFFLPLLIALDWLDLVKFVFQNVFDV